MRKARNVRSWRFYLPFGVCGAEGSSSSALNDVMQYVRRGEHPVGVFESAQNTDVRPCHYLQLTLRDIFHKWNPFHGLPLSRHSLLCRRKHIFLNLGPFLSTTKSLCPCTRRPLRRTKPLRGFLMNSKSLSRFVDQTASSFSTSGLPTAMFQFTGSLVQFRLAT